MSIQRYSVTPHPIETLLTWIKSGEIAVPEIQRPFVWDQVNVRDLLDSLYRGYPVGYLITWRNPSVRLKDGSRSTGKRILIDGQQRVTALMAALLGQRVLTKNYESIRIKIAFHPGEGRFEVANPVILKDSAWIPDIATLFHPDTRLLQLTKDYVASNPGVDEDSLFENLDKLRKVVNNHVGIIELSDDLDIETVTEIFIRVNSKGAQLSQADFAMSKIAANEVYGGNQLRKAIDYFCHLAVAPDFADKIESNDPEFARTEFFPKMKWMRDFNSDIYDPTYTDMLRVAFTSRFRRGKLQDLVALLSGRNFETKQYEDQIAEESFAQLKAGITDFMNETHFKRLSMILESAGFVTSSLIRSANAVNFAYVLYLHGRSQGMPAAELERIVRRWYVMSVLRSRYSAASETSFDYDIRQVDAIGMTEYIDAVISSELSDEYWTTILPQQMDTPSSSGPLFSTFLAAQIKLQDRGFASRDITALDLVRNRTDVHHIYPAAYLKRAGLTKSQYNQIANMVLTQSEINIQISDSAPEVYFAQLSSQCAGGALTYGGITDIEAMRDNLRRNCIPIEMLDGQIPAYEEFLKARRILMAARIREYFESL